MSADPFDLVLLARGERPGWLSMTEMPKRLAAEVLALRQRVVDLEAELGAARKQVEGHCERIAIQSELLSRKAEK